MQHERNVMGKMKSKEQVIAELEVKQIPYTTEMTYKELCDLNKDVEEVKEEKPLIVDEVTLGVKTINDHEYRLAVIEKKLGLNGR